MVKVLPSAFLAMPDPADHVADLTGIQNVGWWHNQDVVSLGITIKRTGQTHSKAVRQETESRCFDPVTVHE